MTRQFGELLADVIKLAIVPGDSRVLLLVKDEGRATHLRNNGPPTSGASDSSQASARLAGSASPAATRASTNRRSDSRFR